MIKTIIVFVMLSQIGCNNSTDSDEYPDFPSIKDGYPHLAMW